MSIYHKNNVNNLLTTKLYHTFPGGHKDNDSTKYDKGGETGVERKETIEETREINKISK